jgi:prepilin-type N-terminal cleavage/methylation domain-containing protein
MQTPSIHHHSKARYLRNGFTIMETIVTILVIGVAASMVIPMLGQHASAVKLNKLEADAAAINRAVKIYKADGGRMTGIGGPQDVIEKLKRSRSAAEQRTQVGVTTGRQIDVRLNVKTRSGGTFPRAVWNSSMDQFEIKTDGSVGVEEFFLDDALAGAALAADTRTASALQYNGGRGWVWGTGDDPYVSDPPVTLLDGTQVNNPFDPSIPETTPGTATAGSATGTGTATSGGTGSGTSTAATPTALPAPTFSPGPGTYPFASYPSAVTLSNNGAPAGSSALMYRLNGGAWNTYSTPITVPPGSFLEARNVATNSTYTDSGTSGGSYFRLASGLTANTTATWLTPAGNSTLVYSLNNKPNTATLTHGSTVFDDGMGGTIDSGVENVLTYKRNNLANVAPNTTFTLGDLTLLNGTTFNDSEATAATLAVTLNFASPNVSTTVNINFGLINTDNSPDRLASADIVELRTPNAGTVITIDGVNYQLELSWVTLDPSAGVVSGNQFLIFEGGSAKAELRGRLVADR